MASKELVIDDDYCAEIGSYIMTQGQRLEQLIDNYITILNYVREYAITGGETATALGLYIEYAKKLNDHIDSITAKIQKEVSSFLKAIDDADRYLF